ncbi:MAG: ABC transporter ATP-binding protein [Firmicutes bacterium]|nr:ABC transporter ATP-binding protein [Bacillota bacterium]
MSLLSVEGLKVTYGLRNPVYAVRGVSFEIFEEEFVGLVGESGCGKSTLGFAIARLERPPARIAGGRVVLDGRDWTAMSERELRPHRWKDVSVVLQSGMNALNPVMTIEAQFRDVMVQHTDWSEPAIRQRALEVLDMVHIDRDILFRYPHELSGGMKQRVVIAMAFLLHPKLIILDEPTTALDMVVQREIMDNLMELRGREKFSLLFISHDLGLVLEISDRVLIMYAGQIVEENRAENLLEYGLHPYTQALMRSLPVPGSDAREFHGLRGSPPNLRQMPKGCAFAPRCDLVTAECHEVEPDLEDINGAKVRCHVVGKEVRVRGSEPSIG